MKTVNISSKIIAILILITIINCYRNDSQQKVAQIPINKVDSLTRLISNKYLKIIDSLENTMSNNTKSEINNENFTILQRAIYVLFNIAGNEFYGYGTAFVIDSSGLAISNYHVVEGADKLIARRSVDTFFISAKILEINSDLDYAILKFDSTFQPYDIMKVSSDLPSIGSDCYAIGHPIGESYTLTKGIISQFRWDTSYIQTDAAISQGNSGGPLINSKLEVVGVNTMSKIGGQNLNFSLSINMVPFRKYLPSNTNITVRLNPNLPDNPSHPQSSEVATSISNKVCLDRAVRTYLDALVYNNIQGLEAICAQTLMQLENERNVKKSEVGKILKGKGLDKAGYTVEKSVIEWENVQYQHNSASADYIITFKNSKNNYIISHLKANIVLNNQCEIIRAQTELINSF